MSYLLFHESFTSKFLRFLIKLTFLIFAILPDICSEYSVGTYRYYSGVVSRLSNIKYLQSTCNVVMGWISDNLENIYANDVSASFGKVREMHSCNIHQTFRNSIAHEEIQCRRAGCNPEYFINNQLWLSQLLFH